MNKPVQGLRLPSLHLYHKVNVYISNFSPTWRPIYPADRNQEHNKVLIYSFMYSFNSVQFSRSVMSNFFRPHGLQHTTPPCPSPIPGLNFFTQTHVHWVGDAIQPSHPWSSASPPTFNLSQHQGLFKGVISSHQVAKVLEFQLQQ